MTAAAPSLFKASIWLMVTGIGFGLCIYAIVVERVHNTMGLLDAIGLYTLLAVCIFMLVVWINFFHTINKRFMKAYFVSQDDI